MPKLNAPAGEVRRVEVVPHALDVEAQLQRMPAAQDEDVLARLERRELEASRSRPRRGRRPRWRGRARAIEPTLKPGMNPSDGVMRAAVQHGGDIAALRRRPRQAEPRVTLTTAGPKVLRGTPTPRGAAAIGRDLLGQERIWLLDVGVVEHDGGVEAALRRQLVIDPAKGIVPARDLVAHRVVYGRCRRCRAGARWAADTAPAPWAICGSTVTAPAARRPWRAASDKVVEIVGLAELLAQALVVAERERTVLDQRAAEGDAGTWLRWKGGGCSPRSNSRARPSCCCGGTRTRCRGSVGARARMALTTPPEVRPYSAE